MDDSFPTHSDAPTIQNIICNKLRSTILVCRGINASIFILNSRKKKLKQHDISIFSTYTPTGIIGISQLSQSISFLVGFLYDRPDILLKLIKSNTKSNTFDKLINITIPSIFGHFVSQDHIQASIRFYHEAIEQCKPKLAIQILSPFFAAYPSFRFAESVFLPFIDDFIMLSINKHTKIDDYLILSLTNNLYKLVAQSITLLPENVLITLRYAYDCKWKQDDIWSLFWDNFSVVLGKAISGSTAKPYISTIEKVFDSLKQFKIDIIQRIYYAQSLIEIPKIPNDGTLTLPINVFAHDIISIALALSTTKMLPDTVSFEDFNEFSSLPHETSLWAMLYPRQRNVKTIKAPLFSDHSLPHLEEAIDAELARRSFRNGMLAAKAILEYCARDVCTQYVEFLDTTDPHNFILNFNELSKQFKTKSAKRSAFLVLLDTYVKKDLETKSILDKVGQNISLDAPDFLGYLDSLPKQHRVRLLEAVKALRRADNAGFPQRFGAMSRAFSLVAEPPAVGSLSAGIVRSFSCGDGRTKSIEKGIKGWNAMAQLVAQGAGSTFLYTFVTLSALALKSPVFVELCRSGESERWSLAESAVRSLMGSAQFEKEFQEPTLFLIERFTPYFR